MKQFLLLAICLFHFATHAQPTLTSVTNGADSTIHTIKIYGGNGVHDPGPAGAAQTWDFTADHFTSYIYYSYLGCKPQVCDSFPGSAFYAEDLTGSASFMNTSSTKTEIVGGATLFQNGPDTILVSNVKRYGDRQEIFHYPFTYGNGYLDKFTALTRYGGANDLYEAGYDSLLADGWGTVKTERGTYANALRVKWIHYQLDSSGSNGLSYSTSTYYSWYVTSQKSYVYRKGMTVYQAPAHTDTSYYTQAIGNITGIEDAGDKPAIPAFPNPVNELLHLQINSQVLCSITIIDFMGIEVSRLENVLPDERGNVEIPVQYLAGGMYCCKIRIGGTEETVRFLKR